MKILHTLEENKNKKNASSGSLLIDFHRIGPGKVIFFSKDTTTHPPHSQYLPLLLLLAQDLSQELTSAICKKLSLTNKKIKTKLIKKKKKPEEVARGSKSYRQDKLG